jgi:hypothetical protein
MEVKYCNRNIGVILLYVTYLRINYQLSLLSNSELGHKNYT